MQGRGECLGWQRGSHVVHVDLLPIGLRTGMIYVPGGFWSNRLEPNECKVYEAGWISTYTDRVAEGLGLLY